MRHRRHYLSLSLRATTRLRPTYTLKFGRTRTLDAASRRGFPTFSAVRPSLSVRASERRRVGCLCHDCLLGFFSFILASHRQQHSRRHPEPPVRGACSVPNRIYLQAPFRTQAPFEHRPRSNKFQQIKSRDPAWCPCVTKIVWPTACGALRSRR